jgi:hypothetical protein
LKEDSAADTRSLLLTAPESNLDEYVDVEEQQPSRRNRRRRKRHQNTKQSGRERQEIRIDISVANVEDPVKFCSRSEAICAHLLSQFIPHFELQNGVTFQVPVGEDRSGNTIAVDFLVDGVLFEYHPVRFFQSRRRCGDFNDRDEYRSYAKVFHALNSDKREFFHEAMRARLTMNYFNRRRSLLDQHPLFRRTELIVATTPEEFYERIIKRFGKNYPKSVDRFLTLFDELMRTLPS